MPTVSYQKALDLLRKCTTPAGFTASAENVSNYKRVWARDGVICGLAALASGEKDLITTFKNTLETLAEHQHDLGTVPSNVQITDAKTEVSYGGLAGRVDAVTWFVIGICQYGYCTKDVEFVARYQSHIHNALRLLDAWEFNNKHLLYVPLSGNWADEYITDGYVLYDQLLRLWALRSYQFFNKDADIATKIKNIESQIETNFLPNATEEKYHEKAYQEHEFDKFMPCSFSPSGYKKSFDAFANSLALLLNIGKESDQEGLMKYMKKLQHSLPMKLLPAFWPPIEEGDADWNLLKNNCKYEFRNYPNEFHNGGSWPMVNGFYGLALWSKNKPEEANGLLKQINSANAQKNYSFYENFNSISAEPNGVPLCAWSAAATVLVHQSLTTNFKLLV